MRAWYLFWFAANTSISIKSQEGQALANSEPLKAVLRPESKTGTNPNSLVVRNVIHSTVKSLPTTSPYKYSLCILPQLLIWVRGSGDFTVRLVTPSLKRSSVSCTECCIHCYFLVLPLCLSSIFSVTYTSLLLVILLSSIPISLRKVMYLSIFKGNVIEVQSLAFVFIGNVVTGKFICLPELCI